MLNLKKSKKYYDKDADVMYAVFSDGVEDFYEEIAPGINIEYDKDRNIIGVEYLNYSKYFLISTYSDKRKDSVENFEIDFGRPVYDYSLNFAQ